MPEFDYVVIDGAGREKRGLLRADNVTDARAALAAKKLFVVRIAEGRGATGGISTPGEGKRTRAMGGRSLLSFERNRLSPKDLTLFTRQLSTLAQVSPLEEALRTITRQSEKQHVREVVGRVHSGVVEGRSLGEAMSAEPRSFPGLYRAMIAAGERSGSLPALTERLAVLLERQAVMRSKLLTALAYPTVLATFAVIVVISLMMFVVPLVVEQSFPDSVHPDNVAESRLYSLHRTMAEANGPGAYVRQQQAILARPDSRPMLAAIRVPTTIIVGEGDRITPPASAETMHRGIAGSVLEVIPRAGHLALLEQPELVNAALRAWATR